MKPLLMLLLIEALCLWFGMVIAKRKNIQGGLKYLGVLGLLGLAILAFMSPRCPRCGAALTSEQWSQLRCPSCTKGAEVLELRHPVRDGYRVVSSEAFRDGPFPRAIRLDPLGELVPVPRETVVEVFFHVACSDLQSRSAEGQTLVLSGFKCGGAYQDKHRVLAHGQHPPPV